MKSNGPSNRAVGAGFEHVLQVHANSQGVLFYKLPIGAKPIGRGKWIKQKTPFDYVMVHEGTAVFLDCKTLDKDHLTPSDMTPHQVQSLFAIWEHGGMAGYLVHFRPINKVVFFEADKLAGLQERTSLNVEDGEYLGTLSALALGSLFYISVPIKDIDG